MSVYIFTSNVWVFQRLCILNSTFGHPSGSVVVPRCGFNAYIPMTTDIQHLYVHLLAIRYFLFWCSFLIPWPVLKLECLILLGFPGGSDGKESACNEGDPGSIPGSGRFPGEGNIYSVFFIYPEHKSFVRCVLWLFSPSLWLAFSLSWWCCYFFLKCLVESISEAIWVWSLYKILNYRLNEQNEIGFPLPTSVSVVIFKGYFSFPLSCLIY